MQCPGQDTRYWKPDDIFEIPCQACGHPVEFFKTDAFRRCRSCGKRLQNPKISLGCARWCSYAKECLGFDPEALQLADSAERSLVDQLVEEVKTALDDDQERITHALLVLDRAQEIMRREGGDPRVVLAAALLHDIGPAADQEASAPARAQQILEEVGMDAETTEHVCRIVDSYQSGEDLDTVEFQIVWDADRLMAVPEGVARAGADRLKGVIDKVFKTETGRLKACKQFIEQRAEERSETLGAPTSH